jgi:hypothetical protein
MTMVLSRLSLAAWCTGAMLIPAPSQAQTAPPTPQAQIQELTAQLRRQTVIADNARQEMERLRAEAQVREELIVLGRQRNAELYAIANEVIALGLASRSREPFLQAHRVRMENLRQSYEDRLNAARIYATTLPPSVQQRMDDELRAARKPAAAPATATPAPRN